MATIDINAAVAAADITDNNSKKAMVYKSDTGIDYLVDITESIGEAMGFDDVTTSTTATPLPKGYKLRTVSFKDSTGKVSGTYPCGKPDTPVFVEGGTIKVPRKGKADGLVCAVIGAQGEKRRFFSANDTGQQDNDNS